MKKLLFILFFGCFSFLVSAQNQVMYDQAKDQLDPLLIPFYGLTEQFAQSSNNGIGIVYFRNIDTLEASPDQHTFKTIDPLDQLGQALWIANGTLHGDSLAIRIGEIMEYSSIKIHVKNGVTKVECIEAFKSDEFVKLQGEADYVKSINVPLKVVDCELSKYTNFKKDDVVYGKLHLETYPYFLKAPGQSQGSLISKTFKIQFYFQVWSYE